LEKEKAIEEMKREFAELKQLLSNKNNHSEK
jgi:hypothetical protein